MFLVDSNILIEAKNRYYAFDIAPGFSTWLEYAHQQGSVCSIEAVRDEILEGDDELAEWAERNASFFKPIDQPTTSHFTRLQCRSNCCLYGKPRRLPASRLCLRT